MCYQKPCRTLSDMEKEHLFNELGAPTDTHILSDSVSKIKYKFKRYGGNRNGKQQF